MYFYIADFLLYRRITGCAVIYKMRSYMACYWLTDESRPIRAWVLYPRCWLAHGAQHLALSDTSLVEVEEAGLMLEWLATMCNIAKDLQEKLQDWDDDMVSLVHFCSLIKGAMTVYRNIFTVKKKQRQQLPITMFLSWKKTAYAFSGSYRRGQRYTTWWSASWNGAVTRAVNKYSITTSWNLTPAINEGWLYTNGDWICLKQSSVIWSISSQCKWMWQAMLHSHVQSSWCLCSCCSIFWCNLTVKKDCLE